MPASKQQLAQLLSRDLPISKTSLSYGINFFWRRLLQQKRRLLVAKVHTSIKASSLKRLKTFSSEIVYCELKFLKTEFSYSVTHTCLGQIRECPWETSQASELFKADLILILGWFSNKMGMAVENGTCKSNNWPDQWQSGKLGTESHVSSFLCAFPSSTEVSVLLLNQPTLFWIRQWYYISWLSISHYFHSFWKKQLTL